ncbi:MAG: diguanylate cyclase, partial [Lachnospiraceae bacterium]|nr:diguanylate cyclase [Lachnospiraceae bacterium]
RVDEKGTYVRGSLFYVAYIFSYIYVVVACFRTFHILHTKTYTTDRRIVVLHSLFPLAPGLAGIIQYFYPRMPVACVTMAITTLLFYHTWIDQLISLDPLTGLNNRKQLDHFYEHWGKNHNEGELLYILMIDANKFKYINDNFGHIQGDQALKNIAEALRISCKSLPKRANISRYVGDEFAVLFEASGPCTSLQIERNILETLEKVNEQTDIPFKLTVSIGSSYTDGSLTLKELIDKPDEDMYEEKSAYAR